MVVSSGQGLSSVYHSKRKWVGFWGWENPLSHVSSEGGVVVDRVSPLSLETQVGGVVVGRKTPLSCFEQERDGGGQGLLSITQNTSGRCCSGQENCLSHISSEQRSAVVKGCNEEEVILLAALKPKEKPRGVPFSQLEKYK